MVKKPLSKTNPHLKDPDKYRNALKTNVASSTAVETGESVQDVANKLTETTRRGKRPILHLKKKLDRR